jgi:hypothetical protein
LDKKVERTMVSKNTRKEVKKRKSVEEVENVDDESSNTKRQKIKDSEKKSVKKNKTSKAKEKMDLNKKEESKQEKEETKDKSIGKKDSDLKGKKEKKVETDKSVNENNSQINKKSPGKGKGKQEKKEDEYIDNTSEDENMESDDEEDELLINSAEKFIKQGFTIVKHDHNKRAKFIVEQTALPMEERTLIMEIVNQTKNMKPCTFLDEVYEGSRFTHLIVPEDYKGRSLKIMFAIAHGAHIVKRNWIYSYIENASNGSTSSSKSSKIFSAGEEAFLAEKWKLACERSRTAKLSYKERKKLTKNESAEEKDEDKLVIAQPLFANIKITAVGQTEPSVSLVRDLVCLCGGTWVGAPRAADYCIVGKGATQSAFKSSKATCVTISWLLDCIENYELVKDVDLYLAKKEDFVVHLDPSPKAKKGKSKEKKSNENISQKEAGIDQEKSEKENGSQKELSIDEKELEKEQEISNVNEKNSETSESHQKKNKDDCSEQQQQQQQ